MHNRYEDIIDLPHPTSKRHRRMSAHDRAAQFAPFAALTGYDAMVAEQARWTDEKIELDEMQQQELDAAIASLMERIAEHPRVSITRFLSDKRKKGGKYVTVVGEVQNIEEPFRRIVLKDGSIIPFDDIFIISEKSL